MKTLPFFLFRIPSGANLRRSFLERTGLGLSILGTMLITTPLCLAGTVTRVTDSKIIIDFEGQDVPEANTRVTILDQETQKEIGLAEITKTKDSRALGKILKGTAKQGDSTDLAVAGKKIKDDREPAEEAEVTSEEPVPRRKPKIPKVSFGLGAKFIYNSFYIDNGIGSGEITGNSFGFGAYLDMGLTRNWALFTSLGLHPLAAKTTISGQTFDFSADVYALEAIVRYSIHQRNKGLWIGGGIDYMIPAKQTSTTKNQLAITGSAGFNIPMGRKIMTLKGDVILWPKQTVSGGSSQVTQFVLGGVFFF